MKKGNAIALLPDNALLYIHVPDNMDDSKQEYSARSHRFPPHAVHQILLYGLYFSLG